MKFSLKTTKRLITGWLKSRQCNECMIIKNFIVYTFVKSPFLYYQMDGSEKCLLDIIYIRVTNKCVLDVSWYGPFMTSVELYRPECIKPTLKGQPKISSSDLR